MRFSARVFILSLCLFFLISSFGSATASAQTIPSAVNPYNVPNTEANVPANQHTRVQTILIDLLSATSCIVAGIDPLDKNHSCLGVNPQTGKIGYSPTSLDENGEQKIGGLLGASTAMVAILYTPSVSSGEFGHYMAQNFGIVKKAYAQDTGYGFTGLSPVLALWTAIRNMAYFILMVAFIIIGLGIMLRVKIDPRTVMSLQNQIPRIIICIVLVTFSYPIAGALIDTMWLTTYVGINVITSAGGTAANSSTNPTVPGNGDLKDGDPNKADGPLSQKATANLLQTPVTYVNDVFRTYDSPGSKNVDSGIGHIADEVSYSLGSLISNLVKTAFLGQDDSCGILSLGGCIAFLIKYVATFLFWIIIIFIVLKTLFSVWFTLLKAYTYVILLTIGAPFFIVMGLLPGNPLGIEKWLRSMLANLAVFPLTAFIFVLARLFIDLFNTADDKQFIPPLVGQPNIVGFMGVLIAFGLLLMTPTVLVQLQEALKVPGNKYGGAAIGGFIAAGAAGPKALTGTMWKHATRPAKLHEHDAGWLRQMAAGGGQRQEYGAVRNWIQKQRGKLVKFNAKGESH
jgi:hypothetical protein